MSRSKKIFLHRVILAAVTIGFFLFLNFYGSKSDSNIDEMILESTTERQTEPATTTQETTTEPEIIIQPETDEITTAAPEIAEDFPEPETRTPAKITKKIYQDKFEWLRGYYNNEDIIGIIKVPGTVIFYPVVHYPENNNYYLDRNYFKQRSAAGTIFMDYENSVERQDPNTILYGHQMSSNSMFHSVGWFKDIDYFNEHRYVIFNTVYENSVWEVFAFLEADIKFNYIKVFFNSERDFLRLAREISEKAYHTTGVEIVEGDRILIMSTCTNIDPSKRYVVASRLVKNKEDIPEDILNQMNRAIDDYFGIN